jgi:hypothetical protein
VYPPPRVGARVPRWLLVASFIASGDLLTVRHKLSLKRHKFPPKTRTYAWKADLGFNSGNDARTPKYACLATSRSVLRRWA